MSESEFRADVVKNRLYLRLSGFFRETEVLQMFRVLTGEIDKLRHGFDVVIDMTSLKPGSPESAAIVHKAGELLKARGRRHGVWISAASPTTLLQFKRELGTVFDPETTRMAGSAAEAEHILETWDAAAVPVGGR